MRAELVGDARRRVRASFEFSDEQHFYGLGRGGLQLDRLGIARQLWVTEATVEKHVHSILGKLRLQETSDDNRRVRAVITFLDAR